MSRQNFNGQGLNLALAEEKTACLKFRTAAGSPSGRDDRRPARRGNRHAAGGAAPAGPAFADLGDHRAAGATLGLNEGKEGLLVAV